MINHVALGKTKQQWLGSSKNPSFPRRRESSTLIFLGSRFRGNDESRVFRGARLRVSR
ncbi:hypothetical protein C8D83_101649 [Halothiobacillus neapolitanus]|nr:hypothetical protein C8D83_101649 [Halothiobacillus neapolitanus]